MGFLSRFFSRNDDQPLPELDDLLRQREVDPAAPGLEAMREEFAHLRALEREPWADALAELIQKGQPLPPAWHDAQYELLPEVVPTWLAEREDLFYRPIMDGLSERIRVQGTVMPRPWLTLWGVSAEDVTERALDLLREHSKGKPFQRQPSGIYQSTFGDGLDAARILLPECWCDLFPGQNTFVALPREDRMLVSPQVLLPKLLEGISAALQGEGRRVQATILQWVDGKLLAASLQDPHPIAQPQRELRQSDLMEAYQAQEACLDPELGVPAPMGTLKTQNGRAVTFTLWAEGRPVLLPDADLVAFLGAGGQPMGIYFRQTLPRIAELKGDLVDIWGPRRLRFDGFPTAAQLDRLEAFATPEQMAEIFKQPAPAAPRPQARVAPPEPAFQGSSPLPPHLRGQSLGVQQED